MAEREAAIAKWNSVPLLNLIRQQGRRTRKKEEGGEFAQSCHRICRLRRNVSGRKEIFFPPHKFVKENGKEHAADRKTVSFIV